ncbi:MAG: methionine gamma-lyase family protein, partial [Clostridia bacterium]|nr:methionine gamma-lyase family protein [Clostridia bacterium]
MNSFFKVDEIIANASARAMETAAASFAEIDAVRAYNQEKVLAAFVKNSVNESHFTESTGYGYGD